MTNQYIFSMIVARIAVIAVIAACGFAVGGALFFFGVISVIDIKGEADRRRRIDLTYMQVMTHRRRADPDEDWLS